MTFRCPSPADVLNATLALLPRGRAWQTNEGYPQAEAVPGFNPLGFNPDAFSGVTVKKSVLLQYWSAVAAVFTFLTTRICNLRLEFWCATQSETRDLWMQEYGLPDLCDPFPDLCAKVAAIGGTRCEYYQFIAERAGWRLQCFDGVNVCGARAGSGRARAGAMMPGRPQSAGFFRVVVDIGNSPAIASTFVNKLPRVGRFRAGRRLSCFADLADISPVECLLARVVHAEVEVVYEIIQNPPDNLAPAEAPLPPAGLVGQMIFNINGNPLLALV